MSDIAIESIVHREMMKNEANIVAIIRVFAIPLIAVAITIFSPDPAVAISDRKIEDARFACTSFMKGESEKSRPKDIARAQVARFWVVGFLTGAFEAEQVLKFTDETDVVEGGIFAKIKEFCSSRDKVSIHAAAVYAGETPYPVPTVTNLDLNPSDYSCAAYSDGLDSRGNEKSRAKAAEFWAFAFVQGTMTVRYHPRVVVAVSEKRKIVRALKQSCARNPTRTLLDQTAEIASRVRPEWDSGDWD